jgi:hypothetical protein
MVANLLEKGAYVDARDEVRIDMFVGPMYRPTSYPGYFLLFSVHDHLLRKYPGIVWSRVSQNLGGNNKFLSGWVTK